MNFQSKKNILNNEILDINVEFGQNTNKLK